jgi:hypothetical protein
MRNPLALAVLSLALAACGPALVTVGPTYPPPYPTYVETWPGGGCWADGIWYEACPWYTGPQVGYYYRQHVHWYWSPPRTRDHRRLPPPPRVYSPSPGHRAVPPPRVRDHRRHR